MGAFGYVYALTDPVTGAVRYIGQARRPLQRLKQHWATRTTIPSDGWMRLLDVPPGLVLLEECESAAELGEAEGRWLAHYAAAGSTLTNIRMAAQNAREGGQFTFMMNFRITNETAALLTKRAKDEHVSASQLLRRIVDEFLSRKAA